MIYGGDYMVPENKIIPLDQDDGSNHLIWKEMIDNMNMNMCIIDIHTYKIIYMNKKMKDTYNISHPEGMFCYEVLHSSDKEGCAFCPATQLLNMDREDESIIWDKHNERIGKVFKCQDRLLKLDDSSTVLFHQSKENNVDSVTGLLSRKEFLKAYEEKQKDSDIKTIGMMILDIDDFKEINELYDHSLGNVVLKNFAQFVQSRLPQNSSLYRIDGNQLGILIWNTCQDEMSQLYKNIQNNSLKEEFLECYKSSVEVSCGCALYPQDGKSYEELHKYAEISLQYSKEHGKNQITFFSQSILEKKLRTINILRYLKESINKDFSGFEVYYQPQVDSNTLQVKGVEALLRWKCPDLGFVSPSEFIPILEDSKMILQVELWLIRRVANDCKIWISLCPDFTVSVNVSYIQFLNSDFINVLEQILMEEDFPTKNLIIELTESYVVSNIKLLQENFDHLRKIGIKIAMDDFGTGYSSLGILKQAPADIVKIDRIFVRDILNSTFDAIFIKFIVSMCHNVGIKVCLEGIETEEEYALVSDMDIDYQQGYLFGKPMKADKILEIILQDKDKLNMPPNFDKDNFAL